MSFLLDLLQALLLFYFFYFVYYLLFIAECVQSHNDEQYKALNFDFGSPLLNAGTGKMKYGDDTREPISFRRNPPTQSSMTNVVTSTANKIKSLIGIRPTETVDIPDYTSSLPPLANVCASNPSKNSAVASNSRPSITKPGRLCTWTFF